MIGKVPPDLVVGIADAAGLRPITSRQQPHVLDPAGTDNDDASDDARRYALQRANRQCAAAGTVGAQLGSTTFAFSQT